ncbi:MAG: alpha-galactosidase, partial [Verrucomicrobiota bacterium]
MYGTIVGYNLNDGPNTYNAYGFFDTSGSGAVQGGMTNLSCSGAVYTFPLNISNLGNIVGYYDYADGSGVYYSFTSSVQFPDCQDVGGSNGFFGINDAGWIAGASPWFEGATSWNSFLQTSDTYYMFQIGSGYFSDVDNVNGLGQMIGNYASDTENSGFIDDTGSGNPMDGNIITDFPNAFPISQDWIFTNLDNNQDIAGLAFDDNNEGIRTLCGINPFGSTYHLKPGETFTTPTMIWVWSPNGLGDMSRKLHHWARDFGLRDGHKTRDVLLNNWEATGFDFDFNRIAGLFA